MGGSSHAQWSIRAVRGICRRGSGSTSWAPLSPLWLILCLGSCGGTDEPAPASTVTTTTETDSTPPGETDSTPPGETRCLPLVSGCGCAYQCGEGTRRDDGRYDVIHDYQDSRLDEAIVERRCFDAAGHAFDEDSAPEGARCADVFYDLSPCGGECIPSVEFLDCAMADGRCAPPRASTASDTDQAVRGRLGSLWEGMSEAQRACHRAHPSAQYGDGTCESLQ